MSRKIYIFSKQDRQKLKIKFNRYQLIQYICKILFLQTISLQDYGDWVKKLDNKSKHRISAFMSLTLLDRNFEISSPLIWIFLIRAPVSL